MANRPYFFVNGYFVMSGNVDFRWSSGLSISQKQKNVQALHRELVGRNMNPLEVSTKSESLLGKKLSAFNLKLDGYHLENIYQASKVFENGGPYVDLLEVSPSDAKKDSRLVTSGNLIGFRYNGVDWPLEPTTLFYDYLYYEAVRQTLTSEEIEELMSYTAFTDIEFNPERSLSTQARSITLVTLIYKLNGCLPEIRPEVFTKSHKSVVRDSLIIRYHTKLIA